jgi:hypothetical protein
LYLVRLQLGWKVPFHACLGGAYARIVTQSR